MWKVPTGFAGFHSSIVDNPRDKGFRISHSSMSIRTTFVEQQWLCCPGSFASFWFFLLLSDTFLVPSQGTGMGRWSRPLPPQQQLSYLEQQEVWLGGLHTAGLELSSLHLF